MRNVDPVKALRSAAIFFVIALALKSWGPLASNDSFAQNVVATLIVTLGFTVIMAAFKQFPKTPASVTPVPLDEETAHRVDALLAEGKDVAAVKSVREATGAGLQSAVATVRARKTPDSAGL